MKNQVYISCSFAKRKELDQVIECIKKALLAQGYSPWVFVDNYFFTLEQEKEMMRQAMQDIAASVFLLAETSDKGIGIGIEAGYAKALNKPVVYLRNQTAEHSTTLAGISDYQIVYADEADLAIQVEKVVQAINHTKKL